MEDFVSAYDDFIVTTWLLCWSLPADQSPLLATASFSAPLCPPWGLVSFDDKFKRLFHFDYSGTHYSCTLMNKSPLSGGALRHLSTGTNSNLLCKRGLSIKLVKITQMHRYNPLIEGIKRTRLYL